MLLRIYLCLGVVCSCLPAKAQFTIGTSHQLGHHLLVEPFLLSENQQARPLRRFSSVSLFVGYRSRTASAWRVRHRYPVQGVGLTWFDLGSPDELGRPVALHYTFRAPLGRAGWRLYYTTDVGLAYGWKPYDYHRNRNNLLFSSRTSAYLRLGIGGTISLARHLALFADGGLSHFSNGNVRKPNVGLNALAATIGLRYAPRPRPLPPPGSSAPEPFLARTEWLVSTFAGVERRGYYPGGLRDEYRLEGVRHGVFGLTLTGLRHITPSSRIGLGTSFTHRRAGDTWFEAPDGRLDFEPAPARLNNVRIGVYPTYELRYSRFSFLVQAEYALRAPWTRKAFDRFRQKIGLKCHLGDAAFLAVVLNARQFSQAEFVEWHVGWGW
jgi:hypothetical protein